MMRTSASGSRGLPGIIKAPASMTWSRMCGACRSCARRFRRPAGGAEARIPGIALIAGQGPAPPKKLEMPDDSATYEKIMLTCFSGVHVQLGRAGVKIPHFAAHAEDSPYFCINAPADLEHSARSSGLARVGPAKLQRRILHEIAKAPAHT